MAFIAILLLTVFISLGIKKLQFDYDFEKFFPAEDEETNFFNSYRKKFNSDNDFLLISIERKKGVFDSTFLANINSLSKDLEKKVPYIQSVSSISNQKERFLFPNGGSSERPYINLNDLDLQRDSLNIFKTKELINSLIAKDAKSICLFVKHEDYISKKKSDLLIVELEKTIESYNFDAVHIAGRTIGQKYYIDIMVYEMAFFIFLSALLIVVFLYIAFRSLWGVLIPLVVIALSTLWVVGLMGWFNEPINILLIILPTIMFIVAMSDVIHVVSRYLDALRFGNSKFESIKITFKEVGFATFLTSITTAIGFFSLYFVNVQPIKVFGVVTGIGVLIAFVLTFTLLPVLFYIFPSPKYIYQKESGIFWHKRLRKWFLLILRKRKTVLIIYGGILLLFFFGITKIETNNFLMDDLSAKAPLKIDFNYIDAHYGGIRPFEMAIILKDSSQNFWDLEVLNEVEKVEAYLEKEYGVTVKMSLVSVLKILNRSAHAGNQEYYKLPDSKREIRRFRKIIRIAEGGKFVQLMLDSTEQISRINGTIGDLGNIIITKKNKELESFINNLENSDKIEYKLTGTAHLLDKNMRYLSVSLVKGLSISIILVALIMGLVYRSFSMMLISLIPNLIPLLAIGAVMGYFGIELKTSTAIIFTIAFGIAVDDTIHLLGKFKFELMNGKIKIRALKNAYITTGKAMVLTTLILCSGFLLLVFSSFMGTFFMGLMMSITLFIALIADLTLLPILIFLFYKPKK